MKYDIAKLKEMAERLERATGPLDNWKPEGSPNFFTAGDLDRWSGTLFDAKSVTYGDEENLRLALRGSVNAALALAETLPGDWLPEIRKQRDGRWCGSVVRYLGDDDDGYTCYGPTGALALLRALVAALISTSR